MYQDVFLIDIFKFHIDEMDKSEEAKQEFYKVADKTYIGSVLVPWKECVDRVKDGASPMLQF